MKCFHFSEGKGSKSKFSWSFFSQGNSSKSSAQRASSEPLPFSSEPENNNSEKDSEQNPAPSSLPQSGSRRPADLRVFTYPELKSVTRNFSKSNLLGEGGFGCVYKGILKGKDKEEDIQVAVKQLNRKGQQGHKEWLAEVRTLGRVEHSNLVKLIGYCAEDDERGIQRLLVYEYMENRSLEDHLFRRGKPVLPWDKRLSILLGSASGLAYLHEGIADFPVIFRDFKTSNVLLDKDFMPKLSDFGLARQGPEMGASHVSTAVVGTLGYAAPEYVQTGHLTIKSDVWSFGIVLLEMLTGRRSIDRNRPKSEQQLLDWAKPYLQTSKSKLDNIMDPYLEGQYSLAQAQRIAYLANRCLAKHGKNRPPMTEIVQNLKEIVEMNDESSWQNNRVSTSSSTFSTEAARESIGETTKRRRLHYLKDVMTIKSKEEARNMWRAWTPKPVQA